MKIQEFVQKRLLEICKKDRNLSLYQLSYISGVPYSTIKSIISGKSKSISLQTLKKLADGLDMTLIDFFTSDLYSELEQEIE